MGGTEFGEGAILYNVANESSEVCSFSPMPWYGKVDPVTIYGEKTVYWISEDYLFAYELDKQIRYFADMNSMLPHFNHRFWNSLKGPVLVHLKDDLFNIFSLISAFDPERTRIVECIKFRATKVNKNSIKNWCSPGSSDRVLHLHLLGYQYYRCDLLWNMRGAVPM